MTDDSRTPGSTGLAGEGACPYRHTQPGTVTGVVSAAALVGAAALLVTTGPQPVVWVLAVFGLAGLIVFPSMTVRLDDEHLRLWFGPGFPHRVVRLADIRACDIVTNPWWYGWGIRLTPGGWIYNVGGSHAVAITLRNGQTVRVGTDDAAGLHAAVTLAIRDN